MRRKPPGTTSRGEVPEELRGGQGQDLDPVSVRVVRPPEAYEALRQARQALVGGAAPVLGAERGVKHPKGKRPGQSHDAADDPEIAADERPAQPVELLVVDHGGQRADRDVHPHPARRQRASPVTTRGK